MVENQTSKNPTSRYPSLWDGVDHMVWMNQQVELLKRSDVNLQFQSLYVLRRLVLEHASGTAATERYDWLKSRKERVQYLLERENDIYLKTFELRTSKTKDSQVIADRKIVERLHNLMLLAQEKHFFDIALQFDPSKRPDRLPADMEQKIEEWEKNIFGWMAEFNTAINRLQTAFSPKKDSRRIN